MEHAGREGAATLPNGAILRVTLADSGSAGHFEVVRIDHFDPRSAIVRSHESTIVP